MVDIRSEAELVTGMAAGSVAMSLAEIQDRCAQQPGWRFNLIPLTLMSEDVFRQLARQKGVGENEMVMTLLRDLMETPVDDRIWDAPAP